MKSIGFVITDLLQIYTVHSNSNSVAGVK